MTRQTKQKLENHLKASINIKVVPDDIDNLLHLKEYKYDNVLFELAVHVIISFKARLVSKFATAKCYILLYI